MLVIAPLKPCYLVWPAEAKKWTDFRDLRVEVLHGPKKDEALARDADVYVINPEGLDWLVGAHKITSPTGRIAIVADVKRFKNLGFDILVVDELTKFKHHGSARFKTLTAIHGTFGRRWGLTGTPVPNGLIDLFGQCYVLDQGAALGRFVTHYRREYFEPSFDGFSWILRKGSAERIYERIDPLVLRLAAADYIDMPDLVTNVVRFDLPPKARKIYDKLEAEFFLALDDGVVNVANAATMTTKLRQIASGGIYVDDPATADALGLTGAPKLRKWVNLHDEKVDLVEGLTEELQGSPLLVAYDFQHDLDRLKARFGVDVPWIGGGTSPTRTVQLEALWNRGELPLLLGHPQSIGHGLNLQKSGNHVCWHSLTWDYELYDQFIRRVYRQGAVHKRVFVHHLVARDTIDEMIYWALQAKGKGQQALFDGLQAMKKARRR